MDENIFERKWFEFDIRNTDFKNFNGRKFIIEKKPNYFFLELGDGIRAKKIVGILKF